MTTKPANTDRPILDCLSQRWSPYVFDPRTVEDADWATLFEAARWAASSYNEQPWRFILVKRDDAGYGEAVGCLMDANQGWAQHASGLIFTVVSRSFARNGNPNRVAEHDLGLAVGNLSAQATSMGLVVHQMGGVNLTKVRQTYSIPDGFDPVTAVAVGYAGDASGADAGLVERDASPRIRRALSESVFGPKWGSSATL